ncbi:flavoprotein [Planotetraspora sp. A-T 1434]|uniref:flavoprotein n=1 Tax=Planotetraspora sp. A-T 1434 TaxID=2979219 RepID=UPI0021BEFA91|nr:flavoprotein [Planotetraspora sp. A-T 1434]MCT9931939.1 flavoprotein [Planotetraspora sp. A-T 1434]
MSENSSTFDGRLLIGASGSAAVALLPMFVSALRGSFTGTITVLMTYTATRFIPASTVALFADKVVTGDDPATFARENHQSLTAENDLLVVLPATANLLSAAAAGAAPNLLTAAITAAPAPVVFFPVMSSEMWANRAVRRNVTQLREDGHVVVDPAMAPRYDVAAGAFVESPAPPAPPRFVELVREHLEP